jgi:PP-loop superfamily ATP-utilizing enzyme
VTRERIAAVERVLAARGLTGASVEVCGHTGEIAALSVAGDSWTRMIGGEGRRISEEIRALGFRYVAVDLAE